MVHNPPYDWTTIQNKIHDDGIVYLSDFGLDCSVITPKDLSDSLAGWPVEWNPYQFGQSRRTKLAGQVYSASEYNNARSIPTHHELSYTPEPPRWIIFYAHKAVESGCMRLVDGKRLWAALRASGWNDVLHNEIVYRKCMPSETRIGFGKTWQEHFENADPSSVSKLLEEQGIAYRWLSNGDLSMEYRTGLYQERSVGVVWFAQPRLWHLPFRGLDWFERRMDRQHWPTDVSWNNGSSIPTEFLQWLEEREEEFAIRIQLTTGGLLIVDNHRVAHGREPYVGVREHWVAMGN